MAVTENYGSTSPQPSDTIRILLGKICKAGGGGSGATQVYAYTGANPNADGIVPSNKTIINLAAKPGAATWTWSVAAQNWQ